MNGTTIYDICGKILRDTFGGSLNDDDAFLVFVLFHSNRILLVENALKDCPGACEVAALTQRCVSEGLASMWNGTDDCRADYCYWYYRWNGDWGGYQHAENLSVAERARFTELKQRLERHPFVVGFEPED